MKQVFLVAAVALECATMASGQTFVDRPSLTNVFQIGDREVRIPPPAGFTRIGPLYDHILSVQAASEPAQNEIIALHLPTGDLPKYRTDFDRSPDFFTKVSVSRIGRNEDVTPSGFEAVQAYIEKEFVRLTDPDGAAMKSGQYYVSRRLSELLDRPNKVKWDRPVNLGVFDKNSQIHSTLALLNLSANEKHYTFMGTVSFVYVNARLIYVYAYKSNPTETDIEMLREFTRTWTAAIVAANEELTAKSR